MPSFQDKLAEIANIGSFRKVWSRFKDVIINDERSSLRRSHSKCRRSETCCRR